MALPDYQVRHRSHLPLLGVLILVSAAVTLAFLSLPAEAEVVNLQVPYHKQEETWYCAEASLQMVLDYWGEEIPQHDIGDVANEREIGGTYATDLVRAARFSNISTSIQLREGGGSQLEGYEQRTHGYGAFAMQWTGSQYESSRYQDIMDLVREGHPVIMLCWLDIGHDVTHYRVVKGFDTDTGEFICHDPALGANFRINMTLLVDDLWTYYGRWAMVVAPWKVGLEEHEAVGPGWAMIVRAVIEYPCPLPFPSMETTRMWPQGATATITVAPPFSLAPGENATKGLNISRGGDMDIIEWRIESPRDPGHWTSKVVVMVEAHVSDVAASYGYYTDRIGGSGATDLVCDAVPPSIDGFEVVEVQGSKGDNEVTFRYEVSDIHSDISSVVISTDGGGSWMSLDDRIGEDVAVDMVDGEHVAVLRVMDRVGNVASANLSLTLDSTPPRVLLFQLAGGRDLVTNPRVLVEIVVEDDTTGVQMMAIRVGNDPWGAWEPYKDQLEMDLLLDGDHRVEVRLRDDMDNVAYASRWITVDTTPPYITHFEVAEGLTFTKDGTVKVTFGAEDGLGGDLEYCLYETSVRFDPGKTMASGDTLTLEWTFGGEGQRTLFLTVRDRAHHTDEASRELVVDTQPPIIDLVLNGGKDVTTAPSIPVAVSAIDVTTDVSRARIRINSNEWGPWSDPGSFRRVDLGPGEGERTVHVQVIDLAGNVAEASASVFLDTMDPEVTVRFTRTEPGGVVNPASDIELTFSEMMEGGTVVVVLSADASGPIECDLDWTEDGMDLTVSPRGALPMGSHFVLQVQGKDMVGNDLDFKGVVFSTPETESDDWDAVLPGDPGAGLTILLLVLVLAIGLAYLATRGRTAR